MNERLRVNEKVLTSFRELAEKLNAQIALKLMSLNEQLEGETGKNEVAIRALRQSIRKDKEVLTLLQSIISKIEGLRESIKLAQDSIIRDEQIMEEAKDEETVKKCRIRIARNRRNIKIWEEEIARRLALLEGSLRYKSSPKNLLNMVEERLEREN